VLAPLRSCLCAGERVVSLHCPHTRTLALAVACDALGAFSAALGSTLEGLATLEVSLQWLKRGSGGGEAAAGAGQGQGGSSSAEGGGSGMGTAGRIGVQLTQDCLALGREVGGGQLGPLLGVAWAGGERRLVAVEGGGGFPPSAAKLREALLAAFQGALTLCSPYLQHLPAAGQ
jgi:hypothetical protein